MCFALQRLGRNIKNKKRLRAVFGLRDLDRSAAFPMGTGRLLCRGERMKKRRTILARVFASLFLLVFLVLTGLLIYGALQPEKLPIGAAMPAMSFQTESGTSMLQPDSARMTLLMYFHTNCKYCRAMLQKFDENIGEFVDTRMILLTHESNFFEKLKQQAWPRLNSASGITWGIADIDTLNQLFAPRATPMMYIFNPEGNLTSKISGEAKLEGILNELKKNGGPERHFSGNK